EPIGGRRRSTPPHLADIRNGQPGDDRARIVSEFRSVADGGHGPAANAAQRAFGDASRATEAVSVAAIVRSVGNRVAPIRRRGRAVVVPRKLEVYELILVRAAEVVSLFMMIGVGVCDVVCVVGGIASLTLLGALLRLRRMAAVVFSVWAFTVEQRKLLRPFGPM